MKLHNMPANINLKSYWREILILLLIIILFWKGCGDGGIQIVPAVVTAPKPDTIYRSDTVRMPSPVVREWRRILVPVHDTIYTVTDGRTDTIVIRKTDIRYDTAWMYTDIPVNEYRDSTQVDNTIVNVDIRTTGWLDTLSWRVINLPKPELNGPPVGVSGEFMMSRGFLAPGITVHLDKVGFKYNYNMTQAQHIFGLTFRLK